MDHMRISGIESSSIYHLLSASSNSYQMCNSGNGQFVSPSTKTVMVDFICMGKLGLQGAKTENYKMKNFCP